MDFDTRATILSLVIEPACAPEVQDSHRRNQALVRNGLIVQYGAAEHDRKVTDFLALGPAPFSVIAFHNAFFRQARDAFVLGSYYPALTATCALGERILNHLILALRDDYKASPEYKKVYRKDSFDDWDVAIDTLAAWQVLLPAVVPEFQRLRDVRHRSLHFNPAVDHGDRALALEALKLLTRIVELQFSACLDAPWYIPNDIGIPFVKKDSESIPFVREVVLPSAAYVGPGHRLEHGPTGWTSVDDGEYPETEITDQAFIELFKSHKSGATG